MTRRRARVARPAPCRSRFGTTRGLLVALALAGASACESRVFHVFGAYPYDQENDCLGHAVTVDVLDGPDPGQCHDLRCWTGPDGAVWVTDEACDAPVNFTEHTDDTSGPCAAALAAYARAGHGVCPGAPLDGGSGDAG